MVSRSVILEIFNCLLFLLHRRLMEKNVLVEAYIIDDKILCTVGRPMEII
jgi:hypothetical protein